MSYKDGPGKQQNQTAVKNHGKAKNSRPVFVIISSI
jgi:hypothetical protein